MLENPSAAIQNHAKRPRLPNRSHGFRCCEGPDADRSAFGQVQDSLSFIFSSHTYIAATHAVVERLAGFHSALKVAHIRPSKRSASDRGRELLARARRARTRVRTVESGPLGAVRSACRIGKSTLLRAIAVKLTRSISPTEAVPADWNAARGGDPTGTSLVNDASLREALDSVGLKDLAGKFDEIPTEHFSSLLASSSVLRLPEVSFKGPIGFSSTKQPQRWMSQARSTFTVCCGIGYHRQLYSA